VLRGGDGDDTVDGGVGADQIDGDAGADVIDGGDGDDTIDGGAGDDNLASGLGDDLVLGGAGDDTIAIGSGNDTLDGGDGNDTFVFQPGVDFNATSIIGGNGPDEATDFDVLDLRGAGTVDINEVADASDIGATTGTAVTVTLQDGSVLSFSQIEQVLVDDLATNNTTVFDVAGVQSFDGSRSDVINVAPVETLEIAEGTVAFSFIADDTIGRQGLVSKDADGFSGGGNHFAIRLDGDDLVFRFQDEDSTETFIFNDVQVGEEYEVAATFGANGVAAFVNGTEIGSNDAFFIDWTQNEQWLQVGGFGGGSRSGDSRFRNAFDGEMADVEIYDEVLSDTEISALSLISSFDI
jgi:hypothetical protein